jgi:hypothetical protein
MEDTRFQIRGWQPTAVIPFRIRGSSLMEAIPFQIPGALSPEKRHG